MTATAELAEFVATARHRTMPPEVADHVRLLVLDTIGCGLLGSTLPSSAAIAGTVAATEPCGASTVWGTRLRLSASQAVLVNGASVHACELDDVGAGGHHGSTTLTVALALAESGCPLSGPELLAAIATGIDVGARVADCIGLDPQTRIGLHVPSMVGAFAAAATAAVVLGLDADRARQAFAAVAPTAFGLLATQHGGMGKRLAAGTVAAAGLRAAQLAAHGFISADEVLDGWLRAVSGGQDTYHADRLTSGLGSDHRALGTTIKRWACRAPIHGALEALLALRCAHAFAPVDVERMTVTLSPPAHHAVGAAYTDPSAVAAQMSVRYCLAALLVHGDLFVDQFDDDAVGEPAVLDLVTRVHAVADPALDTSGMTADARLDIALRDGRHFATTGRIRTASAADVGTKFARTSSRAIGRDHQAAIAAACDRLLELDSVTGLAGQLAGQPELERG